MRLKILSIAAATAIVLVASCALQSGLWLWTVTQFHNFDSARALHGKSHVIVPLNKAYMGTLEFDTYAALVAAKLQGYGMDRRPRSEMKHTDFLVALDYGIGSPYALNCS